MNKDTLTVNQIRSKFLNYMKEKGHVIIPSASLVPENDPTTLFTGSGMQPMLPYLLGQKHPLGTRIADSQKCFRSQDIEEVGDNRHTTFFEMLGNWSFGDYFKEEQITWMWDFLIDELKLDPKNFYVTCFAGNDELGIPRDTFSAELWQKLFIAKGLHPIITEKPEEGIRIVHGPHGESRTRIFYYNEKKNWWSRSGVPTNMPEGEPGGPDSEMFYDFDPVIAGMSPTGGELHEKNVHANSRWKNEKCHPNCDCGRFLEIGNNVFMQYKKTLHGFEELPQMNVDHGSGLERYACAVRNDSDIFMIDVFDKPKINIEALSGKKYGDSEDITYAYRVILDHIRAATFLIGDGVLPGSKDQMYYVRRLIRRAVYFIKKLGFKKVDGIDASYNDLVANQIIHIARSFINDYKNDYLYFLSKEEDIVKEIKKEIEKFLLTLEKGIKEFERMSKRKFFSKNGEPTLISPITGEDAFNLLQNFGLPIELTKEICEEKGLEYDFHDFKNFKELHSEASRTASAGKFKGGLGGDGEMEVKYHTATHMLHQALREVLGESVEQKGSNITTERLRFDFSFDRKMTDEEKQKVEDIINTHIKEALPVTREETSMSEARSRGAIGLFGDKYEEKEKAGEKVSIYSIGEGVKRGDSNLFSMEFCGGPHVSNTSELGTFKIQKEEAVSAGVRRIKAVLS